MELSDLYYCKVQCRIKCHVCNGEQTILNPIYTKFKAIMNMNIYSVTMDTKKKYLNKLGLMDNVNMERLISMMNSPLAKTDIDCPECNGKGYLDKDIHLEEILKLLQRTVDVSSGLKKHNHF